MSEKPFRHLVKLLIWQPKFFCLGTKRSLHYLKRKILPDLIFLCIYPTIVSLHENVQPIYSVYLANTKKKMYPIFVPCKEKKIRKRQILFGGNQDPGPNRADGLSSATVQSCWAPFSPASYPRMFEEQVCHLSLALSEKTTGNDPIQGQPCSWTETKKKKNLESHRPRIIP